MKVKILLYFLLLFPVYFLPSLVSAQVDITGTWASISYHTKVYGFNHEGDSLVITTYRSQKEEVSKEIYERIPQLNKKHILFKNKGMDTFAIIKQDEKRLLLTSTSIRDTITLHRLLPERTRQKVEAFFEENIFEISVTDSKGQAQTDVIYKEQRRHFWLFSNHRCAKGISFNLHFSDGDELSFLRIVEGDQRFSTTKLNMSILFTEIEEDVARGFTADNREVTIKMISWERDKSIDSQLMGEWIRVLDKDKLKLVADTNLDSIFPNNPRIRVNEELVYEKEYQGIKQYGKLAVEKCSDDFISILFLDLQSDDNVKERMLVYEWDKKHILFNQIECMQSDDYVDDVYWLKVE